jgi:hypothetical protein
MPNTVRAQLPLDALKRRFSKAGIGGTAASFPDANKDRRRKI